MRACTDVARHAGPEILQLIANQLSFVQWARTLAQVCLSLQLMPYQAHSMHFATHAGPDSYAPTSLYFLQTSSELRAIPPEAFALYIKVPKTVLSVNGKRAQVPSAV